MRKMLSSGKTSWRVAVQLAGRGEVAAERLLDDHARVLRAAGLGELARPRSGTCSAGWRGSGRAARRPPSSALQPGEGRGVVVVAVHVAELLRQLREGLGVDAAAVLGHAGPRALHELLAVPARPRHADHRDVEPAAAGQRLEGREDLLVGEVAGGAEEDEGVGARPGRRSLLLHVAAEAEAHRGEHLVLEEVQVARGEALEEGGGEDVGGHALVVGGRTVQRPSPESDTLPPNLSRPGSRSEGLRREVEEPGGDDAAAAPQLGDVGEVEVVLVVLGVPERRRLRVLLVRAPCRCSRSSGCSGPRRRRP